MKKEDAKKVTKTLHQIRIICKYIKHLATYGRMLIKVYFLEIY